MARATYTIHAGVYEPGNLEINDGTLSLENPGKVVFTDTLSGDKVIFEGEGFDFSTERLTEGVLRKVSVIDANGEQYQIIDNIRLNVQQLLGTTLIDQLEEIGTKTFEQDLRVNGSGAPDYVLGRTGDDFILGRGGQDQLGGGAGEDLLVGGQSSDMFIFRAGDGRDTIRDFDASGGGSLQDYIVADFAAVESIARDGKHTVIDFGDGDTLTLRKIKPGEIDETDFVANDPMRSTRADDHGTGFHFDF